MLCFVAVWLMSQMLMSYFNNSIAKGWLPEGCPSLNSQLFIHLAKDFTSKFTPKLTKYNAQLRDMANKINFSFSWREWGKLIIWNIIHLPVFQYDCIMPTFENRLLNLSTKLYGQKWNIHEWSVFVYQTYKYFDML